MAKPIPEKELQAIEDVLKSHPEGASRAEIENALDNKVPARTLQSRLLYLVREGRVVSEGQTRAVRYRIADQRKEADFTPLSKNAREIQRIISAPIGKRPVVGCKRDFLDNYKPNESSYLTKSERNHLREIGTGLTGQAPAGTYARQIMDRLLIDLSWSSSRLEGNTYTILDTRLLLEFGRTAGGKDLKETQMILNHKDAIEFLVNGADYIAFNKFTITNLHARLANNLLGNPAWEGQLRHAPVEIGQSKYTPLAIPAVIDECFIQILDTAEAIKDPFEQSLFVMVQLPYLQPFIDVNKRVSRLAANIPLIKNNLVPLTFLDVPHDLYVQAMLGVYELNRIDLLKEILLWAYQRSTERFRAIRESLGEPDPFRLKYRDELKEITRDVVKSHLSPERIYEQVLHWVSEHIESAEQEQFVEKALVEIKALHEGNINRYNISTIEFEEWSKLWEGR